MSEKKVIWITGASSGIGKALTIKFAESGWLVAASARRENLLNELNYIYIRANADSWIEIQKNNSEILVSKVIKKGEELKLPY